MSFTALLDQEMSIVTRSISADSYLGQSITRTTTSSGIPCRVNVLTYDQIAILARSGIQADHKFFCDGDVTIEVGNELLVGSTYYEVVSTRNIDQMDHHLEILTKDHS